MLPGYHYQNDRHALQSLVRPSYQPDVQLAVGAGERHEPLGMKVIYKNRREFVVVPDLNSAAYEQASIEGQRIMVSESDFPKENFTGVVLDNLGEVSDGGI